MNRPLNELYELSHHLANVAVVFVWVILPLAVVIAVWLIGGGQ